MSPAQPVSDSPAIASVRFPCECGQELLYRPSTIGKGVRVVISVTRIGGKCVKHEARTLPPGGDA